jgi:hypothetical protein
MSEVMYIMLGVMCTMIWMIMVVVMCFILGETWMML